MANTSTRIEGLERRLLLATFTVSNTGDAGRGSLRQAIADANAAAGADLIQFAIGSGAQTISPLSALPALSDTAGVTLDGTTQAGFVVGAPVITINGASAGTSVPGLDLTGGNNIIRGLVVQNFDGNQIFITGGGGNSVFGSMLLGQGADPSGDGVEIGSPNNRIGGPSVEHRNVIAANRAEAGVRVSAGASGTIIENNRIGTNAAGTAASANGTGVLIQGAPGAIVLDNLISGSVADGITLTGAAATGTLIQGNLIGTNAAGTGDLGNGGSGIAIGSPGSGASQTTVGGTGAGDGNTIGFNDGRGIYVNGSGTGNRIVGNSIFSNASLGIDLAPPDGRTANDADDSDTGANNLQNFPTLTQAAGTTTGMISGFLDSVASATFRIEFFSDPAGSAGQAQGKTFLGATDVTTNAEGIATFNVTLSGPLSNGQFVTATATSVSGNTSEFSDPVVAGQTGPDIQVSGNGSVIANGDVTPTSGDFTAFESAPVGGPAAIRVFSITNTGQTTLNFFGDNPVTVSGPAAAQFAVTDQPNATLAPGQTTSITIDFTAAAAGTQAATVSIASTDPDENPFTFAISGQGTTPAPAPEIEVSGDGNAIPSGDAMPGAEDATNFGTGTIGGTPVTRTFSVANAGLQSLSVGAVTLTGSGATQFSVTQQPASTVAPGQATTFVVQFNPVAGGQFSPVVNIPSNDSDENPYTFAVTALGVGGGGDGPSAALLPQGEQPTPVLNDPAYNFIVRYSDPDGISVSSLDNNDIVVTGPNAFSQSAKFISIQSNSVTQVDAVYRIAAPGGTLDLTDDGTYTATLQPNQVSDSSGNTADGGSIGTFNLSLATARTPIGQFGLVDGKRRKLTFTEPDGTVVTVSLSNGLGQAFSAANGRFDLEVTSSQGKLAVAARGGNGRAEMHDVRVTGSLKSVVAKTGDVTGVLTGGGMSGITLGSTIGATISTSAPISSINILGVMSSTHVFSGALLGSDGRFGGAGAATDTAFGAGEIKKFRVGGSITASLIAAGLDPVDNVLLNENGIIVGGSASRIGSINVRGTVDQGTVFAAGAYPKKARIGGQSILPASDLRFDMTP